MTILLKNKHTLKIDDFHFQCSIGKNGISKKKKEGDNKTPKGFFKIQHLYFRKDRLKKPKTRLKCIEINKNMGWCDDPRSMKYNKLINLPFSGSCEKLFRKENIYDIILVLDFNMNPIRKNKGSAIFIHVAKKNYEKTKGCIAIKKVELLKILKEIKINTKVKIENQR